MNTSDEGRALRNIAQVFERDLEQGVFSPEFKRAVNLAISVCRSTTKTNAELTLIEQVITSLSSHLVENTDITKAYASGINQAIKRISDLETGFFVPWTERRASN